MKVCKQFFLLPLLSLGVIFLFSGCRSAIVDTTIINQGAAPLRLLEFDYPSASFGKDLLPAGGRYHYRFKIQGSGPLTFHFVDDKGKSHSVDGPTVQEGQEGSVVVTVNEPSAPVNWNLKLTTAK